MDDARICNEPKRTLALTAPTTDEAPLRARQVHGFTIKPRSTILMNNFPLSKTDTSDLCHGDQWKLIKKIGAAQLQHARETRLKKKYHYKGHLAVRCLNRLEQCVKVVVTLSFSFFLFLLKTNLSVRTDVRIRLRVKTKFTDAPREEYEAHSMMWTFHRTWIQLAIC